MKERRQRPRLERLLAGIAAAGMVLLLAACGGSGGSGSGSNNTNQGSGY